MPQFPGSRSPLGKHADSRKITGKRVVAHAPRPLSGEQPQNTSISTVFNPVRLLLQVVSTITWFPCCFPYYSTFSKLFPSLFESPSGARILSLRAFSYLIYRFAVISLLALIKFYFNIFAIDTTIIILFYRATLLFALHFYPMWRRASAPTLCRCSPLLLPPLLRAPLR